MVYWVFPEPIFTQGAITANGVHARHDEKPDLAIPSPLELSVQGRKYITAQAGDAILTSMPATLNPAHT